MRQAVIQHILHCFIGRGGKCLLLIVLFALLRPALLVGQGQVKAPQYSGAEQHTLIGNDQPDKPSAKGIDLGPWTWTQEQIILDGTVSDQKGIIIPNTTISLINNLTGMQEIIASDAMGHFVLGLPLSGTIQFDPPHFINTCGSANVWNQCSNGAGLGSHPCSNIFDGSLCSVFLYDGRGDVPLGEKDKGGPSKATIPGNNFNSSSALDTAKPLKTLPEDAFSVLEQEFHNTIELLNWLNDQSSKRLKLIAMVSANDYRSFFVFAKSNTTGALPYCHIFEIPNPNNEAELKAALLAHPTDTFVGMHKISANSVALVFRNGN